jgi:putative transposase
MLPESTFYRILRDADEQHRLARARPTLRGSATEPDHRLALPGLDLGHHLSRGAGARAVLLPLPDRLYLIVDLFRRKIVGWEIHERESAAHAAAPRRARRGLHGSTAGAARRQR